MFGFLKEKLKKALSSFEKKAEELPEEPTKEAKPESQKAEHGKAELKKTGPAKEEVRKEATPEPFEKSFTKTESADGKVKEEKKGFFGKLKEKFRKEATPEPFEKSFTKTESADGKIQEIEEKIAERLDETKAEVKEEKGFFEKLKEAATTKKISGKDFDELFYELEIALLESNVAYAVVEKIKEDLRNRIVDKPIKKGEVDTIVEKTLKESMESLFNVEGLDLIERIKQKKEKPFVIAFVGVNGVGKTSTIAKMAYYLKHKGISCVLAASDTWRAASIEQLEHHANKIGVKIIKHNYGSDPTAVAFDAVAFAKSKSIDVVLIDTAGRQHSNVNLISEMQKIARVIKPDLKLFVGESITGSDCIEQASKFDEAIGIDGIILSKVDVDEKGGAAISIEYVVKKPIIYMGTGQRYEDLTSFDKNKILASIGI